MESLKIIIPKYIYLELYSHSKSSLPIDALIGVWFLSALGGAESQHRKLPHRVTELSRLPDL